MSGLLSVDESVIDAWSDQKTNARLHLCLLFAEPQYALPLSPRSSYCPLRFAAAAAAWRPQTRPAPGVRTYAQEPTSLLRFVTPPHMHWFTVTAQLEKKKSPPARRPDALYLGHPAGWLNNTPACVEHQYLKFGNYAAPAALSTACQAMGSRCAKRGARQPIAV